MRIAIVSCKSKKQDYVCSADEMYSASPTYKTQREYFIKGYDDWYIMSSEYGIIHHTQIIEPYNRTLGVNGPNSSINNKIIGFNEGIIQQIENQIKWMNNQGWILDLHASNTYYKEISLNTKKLLNHIKQPMGPGAVQQRYLDAINMLDNEPLDVCNSIISKKNPNKQPEQDKWFYHNNYESFFGTSMKIVTKFKEQNLNSGAMYKVSLGQSSQSRGWVTDKSLLDKLYQTDKGQWRIKKEP